jgi:hypothetical protein
VRPRARTRRRAQAEDDGCEATAMRWLAWASAIRASARSAKNLGSRGRRSIGTSRRMGRSGWMARKPSTRRGLHNSTYLQLRFCPEKRRVLRERDCPQLSLQSRSWGHRRIFPKSYVKRISTLYQRVAQTFVCATVWPVIGNIGLSCYATRLPNLFEWQQVYATGL